MSRLDPTPLFDASLCALYGGTPLELRVPPYSDPVHKRDSVDKTVRACALYPIIPDMEIGAPDKQRLWTDNPAHWLHVWQDALHPMGYEPVVGDYGTTVLGGESGPLGMFGVTRNPLDPVIGLAEKLEKPTLLLHYITAVALQYYVCTRGLFVRTRTDKGAPFRESLPPYMFLMFRGVHWKVESTEPCRDVAQPFPSFLFGVMRWIQEQYPRVARMTHFGDSSKDMVESFCFEKCRKNYLQALMCMRFREAIPSNMCEQLHPDAVEAPIKFFPHPNVGTIQTLNIRETPECVWERAPQFFTHCFFTPHVPIFVPTERQVDSIWQLLVYFPLSDFEKTVSVTARRVFGEVPEAPGALQLNPVRARYTFYVQNKHAYVFIPNLMLPDGKFCHDESEVSTMSAMAWDYLRNAGDRAWKPTSTELPPATAMEHAIWKDQLTTTTPDPYLHFWTVRTLAGEATAAALSSFTLDQVKASYNARRSMVVQHVCSFMGESVSWLLSTWDRCSERAIGVEKMPPLARPLTPDQRGWLKIAWRMLFPSASIGLGQLPWVQRWRPKETMPETEQAMTAIKCILSKSSLVQELQRTHTPSSDQLPALHSLLAFLSAHSSELSSATALVPKLESLLVKKEG